jgi:hypothetical protein
LTAVEPAWQAVKGRLPSIIAIQTIAILLVISYYVFPSVRLVFEAVGEFKKQGGLLFGALGLVVSGSVIPELARTLSGDRTWDKDRVRSFLHMCVPFAINGLVLDVFYILMSRYIGTGTGIATVVPKILLDSFFFTPFISLPIFLGWIMLRENHWSMVKLNKAISLDTFHDRVIPILIPCWCYWIPLQACIYSLPPSLQYPFAAMCVSAWSIVLVFIAKRMDRQPSA